MPKPLTVWITINCIWESEAPARKTTAPGLLFALHLVFPSLEALGASGLHHLLLLGTKFAVRLDVMLNTKENHIVWIVTESLGLGNRPSRFKGNDVVMIFPLSNPSSASKSVITYLATILTTIADAPLAIAFGSGVYYGFHLCPAPRVQHALMLGAVSRLFTTHSQMV